ncbi:hypothetical protein CAI21_17875 [Alkalilimnicola ehrlichii]|uniref:Phospholipid/glycerol acyltransferase domain-containing protein n=1 Tax=Alkalilimnicola ehrlichii TaxID=351052 RepID=A0A3E0WK11_9GAMM|nr:1-acyl-sn-glycerol-3-phosphate acyltransferase [Alkalilimnicola ehrlichii]RFA25829.1 hypothetical protein CAI21_17875 [Alkalilimnicola ehrlichii]RFA33118.1 hypothetical protein CAL65_18310 [Alkalilimnicola ehrlichii]
MHTTTREKLSQRFARRVLALFGWQVETGQPALKKYILVVYPHTSNWDFPWGYLGKMALNLQLNWMGKDSLFRWPLGSLFRRLGGIPVNRGERHNFITQFAERFRQRQQLILAITPEGTRGHTECWKSGFYYMAKEAEVPVALAYIDYRRKRMGIGEPFMVSGDPQHDLTKIRHFYADKSGRYPNKAGTIEFKLR